MLTLSNSLFSTFYFILLFVLWYLVTQKFLPVNGDDHSRNKAYISSPANHTHTTPKSKRTSSGATGSRSITSPRRRPLPNSNRNERNADLHSSGSIVVEQQNCMNRSNNNSNNNTMAHMKPGSNRSSVIANNNGVEGEHEVSNYWSGFLPLLVCVSIM